MPTRRYRALISIPVDADSDADALKIASEQADSVRHPGSGVVAGHLELVGEVREGLMEVIRIVDADPLLLTQLHPDWKP